MKFWVVTPSYNQLYWLKRCIASVMDQAHENITIHHHIQDADSIDGTQEFLEEHLVNVLSDKKDKYTFSFASEKDNGMYDAINRGWRVAHDDVDIVSHLNCDEQYLPNALKKVASKFSSNKTIDVVLADMIVIENNGDYVCHRRSLKPYAWNSLYCCGGFTATTFHRLSVTRVKNVFFDITWRNIGDKVWYNALHKCGIKFFVYNHLVSVFTDTGENLNWTDEGSREKKRYEDEFLNSSKFSTQLVASFNGLRRFFKEWRFKPPQSYSIYTSSLKHRVTKSISNPTGLWHK